MKTMRVLTLARESRLADRIKAIFPKGPVAVVWKKSIDRLLLQFKSNKYDVMIVDTGACRGRKNTLIELISIISAKSPTTQTIVLAEPGDIEIAMSALKAGSYHYAKLPVSDQELRLLIETAIDERPRFGTNVLLDKDAKPDRMGQIVGRSTAMQKVYEQIRKAAAVNIPVLLLGETGTGKDLVASTIYRLSDQDGPYIPLNLGSLPTELVASELFGHERGAFSGAIRQHKGVFERASDGTVFLDEIDAMEEKIRVSLLRLIEEKRFRRLGGKRPLRTNARLISASNSDLEGLVNDGKFRKDLFYRLDGFRIILPPLRQRPEDIPLLAEEMLGRYNRALNKNVQSVSRDFVDLLSANEWPGNIRELKNVVQRAVLVCEGDELLPEHLPPRFHSKNPLRPEVTFQIGTPLDEVERVMVIRALAEADNNRKEAARLLGISRRAIYNKLRKHNIS
jgi:DNA-binding NtrC family response regulator